MTKIDNQMNVATDGNEMTQEQAELHLELSTLMERHEFLVQHFIVERSKLNGMAQTIQEIEMEVGAIQEKLKELGDK